MELGEKLRQARQEAGLSQRQLCGDIITRNMLSQIEHGTARPSMDTLRSLATRLEKPVSYFLEEDTILSPNQHRMEQARQAYRAGNCAEARQYLLAWQQPDAVYAWEREHLLGLCTLALAQQAADAGKHPLARQLLDQWEAETPVPEQERQYLLLRCRLPGEDLGRLVRKLPSLDEELMLRGEAAMAERKTARAEALLACVEDQKSGRWNLLRGKLLMGKKQYSRAADCLRKAEQTFPQVCAPLLEICFRELGDFQKAYEYACKQR